LVARYGGEEFALILPHTSKANALVLAERLRGLAAMSAPGGSDDTAPIAGYTFSMGVAVFPEDGQTAGELLLAADRAELTAKRLGKNRVCLANDPAVRVAA
jgi:diguanylate cyclase (GGDEF)-like protein